jgi:hypothetical protein
MIRILIEGDLHSGNHLGLAHPDHWPKRRRKTAEALWTWRQERIKEIGRVDIHLLGGDLIDGPGKKGTIGLLTTDVEEQALWAEEAIREVKADHRFFTYGTPFHTISTVDGENLVARAFQTVPRETSRLGPFHGIRLMDRHVLGRSDIPYGQGTQLWKEAVRDQLQGLLEEHKTAHIHTRHHVHYFFEVRSSHARAIACPCWELPNPDDDGNSYPRTLRTMYYDVGSLLIEIDKSGEVYIRPQIMPLKIIQRKEYLCPPIKGND